MNRPGPVVCSVLSRAARLVPGSGTHCLVNMNATSYVMRTMGLNISVFSYMFPAHITEGNATVARANHLMMHGTACTRSFHPVRRNYSYCTYHGFDHTCVHRLFGTRRVFKLELLSVRGLRFLLRFTGRVHRTVTGSYFPRFHREFLRGCH